LLGGCIISNGKVAFRKIHNQYFLLFILTCFLINIKTFATEASSEINFSLKPNLCVLSDTESQCRDQFIAEWNATGSAILSLCLYQEQQEQPLRCWHDTSSGQVEFSLSLGKTTAFELRDLTTQKLFSRKIFEVVYTQKFKRSRRNPWSFF
jgi:hypothetical protein